jgi:hypothetical protein
MSDNVLILGAGFSFNANIPLLSNFIQVLWEMVIRKRDANGKQLSSQDLEILSQAELIRSEMDGYHGRVSFNDRNIEELLSMLDFSESSEAEEKPKIIAFNKAIAKVIDLTCNLKSRKILSNPGGNMDPDFSGIYKRFWQNYFAMKNIHCEPPIIISLNYDLVLERALAEILSNVIYSSYSNTFPYTTISVDYHSKGIPKCCYKIQSCGWNVRSAFETQQGTILLRDNDNKEFNCEHTIHYLKLHGSLNFSKDFEENARIPETLCENVSVPNIVPPVANKTTTGMIGPAWDAARNYLQNAKNIVFVGYSFPKTDVYLQSFLKSALGPNRNLNRVSVFDPILNDNSEAATNMKARFQSCFSQQFQSQIYFNPTTKNTKVRPGTAEAFVDAMARNDDNIFF